MQDHTSTQPRKHLLGHCVWGVMLRAWGVQGARIPLSPSFPSHADTRGTPTLLGDTHPSGTPTLPAEIFSSLSGGGSNAGREVLRHSSREDGVSTSREWVCLSSYFSDLQSSLPRETSCSSAIYDPPLKSTLPMTQPTGFKVCSVLTFI